MNHTAAFAWRISAPALLACIFAAFGGLRASATDDGDTPRQTFGAQTIMVKCKMCDATGKLLCRPPDYGQYKGAIEPKSYWDVRMPCHFCNGKGRHKVYRTSMPPLKNGPPPCTSCGWTGVSKCFKCSCSGTVRCNARDCRNGWIVTKVQTSTGRHSYSSPYKTKVTPCRECKGVGKVQCTYCEGLRATLCRSCNGLGRGKEK